MNFKETTNHYTERLAENSLTIGGWQHFNHDADLGVRGTGATEAEAFEQAALALTAVVTQLEVVEPRQRVELNVQNSDLELLFFDWLNLLIYEMATRKMLFRRYEIDINGENLTASAWGESVDVERHRPAVEIKGATLTELKVEHKIGNGPMKWI
jgi:SHS2 domain-containing protein